MRDSKPHTLNPTLSQVHNAGVALTELERLGVHAGSKDEAKMIVDGHRDTVQNQNPESCTLRSTPHIMHPGT